VRSAWLTLRARYPNAAPKLPVNLVFDGIHLDDWIDRLRTGAGETAWLLQVSSKVLDKREQPRGDKFIGAWLRQLAAAAAGASVAGYLVARDAIVRMPALEPEAARATLAQLVGLWRRNLDSPLPVACKTALALLQEGDPRATYDGGFEISGEVTEPCLARLWPDFAALTADGWWPAIAEELYGPLAQWLDGGIEITALDGEAP
jgi:exodeoxyribonuclease V gamma subunit